MLNGTGCFVHICAFPLLSPFPLLGTFPLPFLSPFLSLITPSPSHATFSRIPLYFSPVQSSPAQQASKQAIPIPSNLDPHCTQPALQLLGFACTRLSSSSTWTSSPKQTPSHTPISLTAAKTTTTPYLKKTSIPK